MENFYVILGVAPNSATNDFVSVGMVAWTLGHFEFKVSTRRLQQAQHLMNISFKNLKWGFDQILASLEKENKTIEATNRDETAFNTRFGPEFFDYLSRYSNGIVRISSPLSLRAPLDSDGFLKYYAILVDELPEKKNPRAEVSKKYSPEQFQAHISNSLILPIKEIVHTEYTIKKGKIPGVFFNVEVDCIGKNGVVLASKSFDFENVSPSTLDKQICHYNTFAYAMNQNFGGRNKFFLVADEPSDVESEAHRQWEAVRQFQWMEYVPLADAHLVANEMIQAKATKFLE